jgi:hypothetical protein
MIKYVTLQILGCSLAITKQNKQAKFEGQIYMK